MARAQITRVEYEKLVGLFREHPRKFTRVANAAGRSRAFVRRAWALGWLSTFAWARPIQEVVGEEILGGRAAAQRAANMVAAPAIDHALTEVGRVVVTQMAADELTHELARQYATDIRTFEATSQRNTMEALNELAVAAQAIARQASRLVVKGLAEIEAAADSTETEVAYFNPDDSKANDTGMVRVDKSRFAIGYAREAAALIKTMSAASTKTMENYRLHLDSPVEIRDTGPTMTFDEAREELIAVQRALSLIADEEPEDPAVLGARLTEIGLSEERYDAPLSTAAL